MHTNKFRKGLVSRTMRQGTRKEFTEYQKIYNNLFEKVYANAPLRRIQKSWKFNKRCSKQYMKNKMF